MTMFPTAIYESSNFVTRFSADQVISAWFLYFISYKAGLLLRISAFLRSVSHGPFQVPPRWLLSVRVYQKKFNDNHDMFVSLLEWTTYSQLSIRGEATSWISRCRPPSHRFVLRGQKHYPVVELLVLNFVTRFSADQVISAWFYMSPCSSDSLFILFLGAQYIVSTRSFY